MAALNKFTSPAPDIASSLKEIFQLCSTLNFDIIAQWRPREELSTEDALSRVPDASDWGLASRVISDICRAFGTPTVDLYASDIWHVAPVYITPRYMPGCAAVDAQALDWRDMVEDGGLAWMFPPVRAIPKALQLLKEFRINTILIVPEASTTNWWIDLLAMKAEAKMEGPIALDRSTDICVPSRRVPVGTVNPALYKLRAFKVTW